MLITEKTGADTVTLRPTISGNGFYAGQEYAFHKNGRGGFYTKLPQSGHLRYVDHVNQPSAHLWDGKNWDTAGQFEFVREGR